MDGSLGLELQEWRCTGMAAHIILLFAPQQDRENENGFF